MNIAKLVRSNSTDVSAAVLDICYILVSLLASSSTLYSAETSVYFQQTSWRYIPEDRNLLL
jgi:hypothetical protein